MAVTTIADMQIVPEKFSQYIVDRTTEKSTLVNAGIATADPVIGQLINGTPQGGRFITIPAWNALDDTQEEDVFGEEDVTVDKITTKDSRATLLIRQKAWGDTDLSRVLGGTDPMAAIINLIADYRTVREQQIYLSILKAILDPTAGALKDHVNDISGDPTANTISSGAVLDTKQALGDAYDLLGMAFMHSATYTYLQKHELITRTPVFNPAAPGDPINYESFMGYRILVDDGMPVGKTDGGSSYTYYDTYFLGTNAFVRQDGTPQGLVTTETDRDKLGAKNYLINRWCQVIHPRGFGWVPDETATLHSNAKYPDNTDLATPANWRLTTNHKKVPIACLRHRIDD